jgi:hypothetical protein
MKWVGKTKIRKKIVKRNKANKKKIKWSIPP